MTTVDDQIRHALETGVPEAHEIDATDLATQLRARGTARHRARRRARIAGAGAVVLVLLLGATVALRDRSSVQVVADGPTGPYAVDSGPDVTASGRPGSLPAPRTAGGWSPGDPVVVSVEVVHCEPLTTGAVTVRVWEERDAAIDPDHPIPDVPAWRVLYQELPVVGVAPLTDDEGGVARSLITVEVPPKAAQWLMVFQEQGVPIWAGPSRDSDVSCAGHPSVPTL